MTCVEAQKYFADLLDDSLDERRRKVNDHLTACSRCRQELAALAACQRLVSDLPPVEPPVGFTIRVMAQVRDAAHRPTVWQRLLVALQFKLPLHATAVILISILAVFVYQSRQRELTTTAKHTSPPEKTDETDRVPPSTGRAPTAESKGQNPGAAGAQASRSKRLTPAEHAPSISDSEEQSNVIGQPGAGEIAPAQDPGIPATITASQAKEEPAPAHEAASARQERSLLSGGAQAEGVPPRAAFREKDAAAKDRTSAAESPSSAGLEEKTAALSLDALSSSTTVSIDRELTLRLKQPARADRSTAAPAELERSRGGPSPSQADFKDLDQGRQRAVETGQPQTLWAIIDSGQYDRFKKELAGLGNIESELPAPAYENDAASKSSNQLRIKVTILPPLSSAERPSSR